MKLLLGEVAKLVELLIYCATLNIIYISVGHYNSSQGATINLRIVLAEISTAITLSIYSLVSTKCLLPCYPSIIVFRDGFLKDA